jgi:hypothetical protein
MRHADAPDPGNSSVGRGSGEVVAQRLPADLAGVVEGWDQLPEALKKAVLALVKAAGGCE